MNGEPGDQDSRKWRRRAALLGLLFLLLFALLATWSLTWKRRTTEQQIGTARELIQSNPWVRRSFGEPVRAGDRPSKAGDEDFTFEVTGSSGSGEADVQMRETEDGRQLKVVGVRVKKSSDRRAPGQDDTGRDRETTGTSGDAPDGTGTTDAGETFDNDTIRFSEGRYSKIIEAVEKIAGKGRVRASTRHPPGGPAWTCVTVDGTERLCLLNPAWTLDDFPVLREAGFQPVVGPASKTLSAYASVSSSAMNYSSEHDDRVIVLVCPKADWKTLRVPWPK